MVSAQDAILIDVSGSAVFGGSEDQSRGGANTSLENNNVYSVEPKVYVETAGVLTCCCWQHSTISMQVCPAMQ